MQNYKALKDKYAHLEFSIVNFKETSKHLIFGSDFNSGKRINALSTLNSKSNKTLIDFFDLINTSISSIAEPTYIYDLTHSLGNFLADVEIANENLGSNKKEAIAGDFIISRLRSYLQEMAVVGQKDFRQLFSSEYLVYRPKTNILSSNTLMAFVLTKTVQMILNHSQYGTEHPRFYEFVLNGMPIPQILIELNTEIELIMKKAYHKLEQSKALYKEAESLLYESLAMPNSLNHYVDKTTQECTTEALKLKFPHLNFSIKPLSLSLQKSGRLDSEYYQSKYENIEALIKSYKGGFCRLNINEIKDTNFNPKAEEKYHYIELANITDFGNINEPLLDLGKNLPTRARRKVKTGDFIMSSIEGSLSSCATITPEFDNCLVSTGFYVISTDKINSQTLLILFKSAFFQDYLRKFPSGTILTAISKDELQNILIPLLDSQIQEQIASKLKLSFALKKEAKELLNLAKNKVEQAIESY